MAKIWTSFLILNLAAPIGLDLILGVVDFANQTISIIAIVFVIFLAYWNAKVFLSYKQLRWFALGIGLLNIAAFLLLSELSFVTALPSAISLIF